MPSPTNLSIFLSAAVILAITPGPGLFYVMTRSLKGGRMEGVSSSLGTALGGMIHVLAAALGMSVIVSTSALVFNSVKYLGALYLIYLGLKIFTNRGAFNLTSGVSTGFKSSLLQGLTVEALNPKTALFFLAFIPQFVNPEGFVFAQFFLLGSISVFLNTSADLIVAFFAGPIGQYLKARPNLHRKQNYFAGTSLIALGVYVALSGEHRPKA